MLFAFHILFAFHTLALELEWYTLCVFEKQGGVENLLDGNALLHTVFDWKAGESQVYTFR